MAFSGISIWRRRSARTREAVRLARLARPQAVLQPEPPRPSGAPSRITHTHSRTGHDLLFTQHNSSVLHPNRLVCEITAIEGGGDAEGFTQRPGARCEWRSNRLLLSSFEHQVYAVNRLDRPDENGVGHILLINYHIEQVMNAITQIDISKSSAPEHRLGARCSSTSERMRGAVVRSLVCLGFHDHARCRLSVEARDEHLADQFACESQCIGSCIETAR